MPKYETEGFVLPSEEIEAYPLVKKLCSINWSQLALENPDPEMIAGFGLLAAYCSVVYEDLVICRTIGELSGIEEQCSREYTIPTQIVKPRHF